MLIFIFLAMNVKYCLTINPVMWFRFMVSVNGAPY